MADTAFSLVDPAQRRPAIPFPQYLRELPPSQVLERFAQASGRARAILSSAEISRIAQEFLRPDKLRSVYGRLSPGAQRACAMAYLLMGEGLPASEAAADGAEALASLLVHAVRDRDGVLYYCGFAELEPSLRGELAATLRAAAARPSRHRQAWRPTVHVVNDCVLTMVLVDSDRLQTTKAGTLAKASLTYARRVLHWGKPHVRGDGAAVFDLVMGYAAERGLMAAGRGGRRLVRDALRPWLSQGVDALYDDVVRYAVGRPGQWYWPLAAAAFGPAGPGQDAGWYSLDALPESTAETVRHSALLGEALGLVSAARHGDETLVAVQGEMGTGSRRSGGAGPESVPTVLPDFSVVLHQECDPAVLQAFSEVGDVEGVDGVYRGKVSREAVADALWKGVGAAELLGRLEQWRAPRNVVETVKEWVREFGRLCVPDERVVLVGDEGVARQIEALERLRPVLRRVPAAGAFRIRPGAELEVRQALAGLGFDTRAPLAWPEPVDGPAIDAGPGEGAGAERVLVTDAAEAVPPARRAYGGGKYGAELKELPATEVDHVIDYAILMGHQLRFAYDGSPWVPHGEYTVTPRSYTSGAAGIMEADDARTGTRKRFLRARIKAIGVVES